MYFVLREGKRRNGQSLRCREVREEGDYKGDCKAGQREKERKRRKDRKRGRKKLGHPETRREKKRMWMR